MTIVINKKMINCQSCHSSFFSIPFEGLKGVFCPYCRGLVKL
ncbi:MAG TPA: hypothetical protein VJH68_05425 [Candidatus Nanoarchaeia archaeon]|nr:hypothetical protein [Candidatus Nanoarchaeia archaeon]